MKYLSCNGWIWINPFMNNPFFHDFLSKKKIWTIKAPLQTIAKKIKFNVKLNKLLFFWSRVITRNFSKGGGGVMSFFFTDKKPNKLKNFFLWEEFWSPPPHDYAPVWDCMKALTIGSISTLIKSMCRPQFSLDDRNSISKYVDWKYVEQKLSTPTH